MLHEIRNPLFSIVGTLDMIKDELSRSKDPPVNFLLEKFQGIQESALHQQNLVNKVKKN